MKFTLSPKPTLPTQVYFVETAKDLPEINFVKEVFVKIKDFKEKGSAVIYLPDNKLIILIYKNKLAVRKAVTILKENSVTEATILVDDVKKATIDLLMANYTFDKYMTEKKDRLEKIELIGNDKNGLEEGIIIGEAINFVRDLANTPGGEMTPDKLAKIAVKELPDCQVTVYDEKQLEKMGMGAVIGVSKGSSEPPRFIEIKYEGGKKDEKPLVFIGKGVTFDTGGLNIKPENHMEEMHLDMSGGAAVIGAIKAISKLKLAVNIVGLIPAVENMPSGSSYHPGDILKTYSGKTIEVINTDAEGRIILADTLAFASNFNPKLIIDVATLTGAAMAALGQRAIALFSNNENLHEKMIRIGKNSGDVTWPLPTWEDYDEEIKGTFGDWANLGKTKYGGAITGAVFLKQFVPEKVDWVHLDIAPTMTTIDGQYLAKGASGTGVRFLIELTYKYSV